MTTPQYEYATTGDGVRIAFVRTGSGPPIFMAPGMGSTIEFGASQPEFVAGDALFNTGLSETHTVIRYDMRGYGMSARDAFPTSVDKLVADLSAVADAAEFDEFSLIGRSQEGQASMGYTAKHPHRVSRLILVGAFTEFNERERATVSTLADLRRVNWGVASRMLSDMFFLDTEQVTRKFAERQRQIAESDAIVALLELNAVSSVREDLERIQAPTLVVHSRDDQAVPFHHGRELAAAIKGARLITFSGDHMVTTGAHREELLARSWSSLVRLVRRLQNPLSADSRRSSSLTSRVRPRSHSASATRARRRCCMATTAPSEVRSKRMVAAR
ncbi:MAG TPA: alpha/beta hydrolase [Dehalococcoidia bacterium]|jgi:pimeloyl-ACP methyl ester carboxylesterase|nr:alpha/beta hydrolase [Dehalococcoidia bacterium]